MEPIKKTCQNCKSEFVIDSEDQQFYQKINVPPPTFCWLCRAQRRFACRNERILYKRQSDLSGKEIFSAYAPDSGLKVYDTAEWLGDDWDPLAYGQEIDFSRPFLEQLKELTHKVPLKSRNIVNGVNSDYTNNITDPKNSYLVFNASNPEDCCYGNAVNFSRDCYDNSHISKCESCHQGFWLTSCTTSYFSSQCENCFDIWFCRNCVGCSNCFGCVGLKNKSYCIWNKQYSKEEYTAVLKSFDLDSYNNLKELREKSDKFWLQFPVRFMEGLHNLQVSGNYIDHSKNVQNSFLVRECEHLRYCQYVQEAPGSKDCYDYSIWGDNNEMLYECHACGIGVSNCKFCLFVQENSSELEYCMICQNSSNLFGCVSLRHKQFCILNKQYTEAEYRELLPKIKQHMIDMPYKDGRGRAYSYGEYFPIELSLVSYNESMAQEYFPLTKEQALAEGYAWRDTAERNYQISTSYDKLSDRLSDTSDSVAGEIISCEHAGQCTQLCTTAFRIIPRELQFYRKHGLPLPRLCPNCRTFERLKQRTGLRTYARDCQCAGTKSANGVYKNQTNHAHGTNVCTEKFETAYPPDSPAIVYCESCYQSEIA